MVELQVTVNGAARAMPDGSTVLDLLRSLEVDPDRVAVERNQEVVPRATWPGVRLADGDHVEVVAFVGGGS